ncbi:MAG: thioredoxin family protein [Bacteroidetes bacterium]|nr:thioredoxin family protein [Bacteroidota bacterium]
MLPISTFHPGRRLCLLTLAFVFFFTAHRGYAQSDTTHNAVSWDFSVQQGADGKPVLVLNGHIGDGWRLYSTTMPDSLPNSRVTLDSAAGATVGRIEERGRLQTQREPLFNNAKTGYFTGQAQWLVHLEPSGKGGGGDLKGAVVFMAIRKDSVVGPLEVPFRYARAASGSLVAKSAELQGSASGANELKKATIDLDNPVSKCGGTAEYKGGLWGAFLLGILGGLVGLFMPCTFPMIPLTVSFFTKRSGSRSKGVANAFLYGFFIFLIYILVSAPFYFLPQKDSNILNTISTNAWLNIGFAVVFIAFALSFFGLFEITLPSSISNSVDSKSNIGSVGGIFFMALTLAIVSFSCTGPILGTIIGTSFGQSGGAVTLTVVLAGFGLALGLPFALFALFPNWLQSLPRSGSWMQTLKIVFGFVEVALALKYLSNADLVEHWGLLKREVFFALWILVSVLLGLFLLGVVKFKHDPPPAKLSKGRIALGIIFIAFGLYLSPGLTRTKYANISLVSGFPPPLSYSIYSDNSSKEVEADVINDYEKALAMAKQQHKPLLIDFTGWACVNCRKMEENVWPKEIVKEKIKQDFILVSLYVDDRKVLPDDQQFLFTTGDGSKKAIKTVGDKYATLQSENFKNVSQPLYVVISPDEKLLNKPVGYTPDVNEYANWLQCGLDAYKQDKSVSKK